MADYNVSVVTSELNFISISISISIYIYIYLVAWVLVGAHGSLVAVYEI